MANKVQSSSQFVRPRDEFGRYIPKEQWSKKDQKAFERMKRQGIFRNPIVKSRKTGKDVWVHPRDPETKQFLPEEKWSKRQQRLFKKAQKEGLLPGSMRDEEGKFVSPTGRKKKDVRKEIRERRTDIYERIAHLEGLIEGALSNRYQGQQQPSVIYIPGQPAQPFHSAVYGGKEPIIMPRQMPRHRDVHQVITEMGRPAYHEGEEGDLVFDDEDEDFEFLEDKQIPMPKSITDPRPARPKWGEPKRLKCDPCEELILEGQELGRKTDEKLLREIEKIKGLTSGSKVKKNALRRPYINPLMYRKKSFSRRFVELVDYFRDRPIMALLGVGAIAVLGYTLYRLIRTYASTFRPGASIVNGVMSFPGTPSYQITQDDMVWMARAIWGEVSRDPAAWVRADVQKGAAAVLWAFANNYMTVGRKRQIFPTFGDFVQAYSQPINPSWDQASDTKCQQRPDMCSADRLAFRQSLRVKPWNTFPVELQNVVNRFVQGTLYNPIGRRTDFRAANTGYQPGDRMIVAGNVFGTDPSARQRQVV